MKKKTLGELLKPANDYERLVADHVRSRHDAALEAAIVEHQRSIGGCLGYIASCASKKRRARATCVMMSDEEVYGLAVHWFLDGDTDSGTSPGAPLSASPAPSSDKPAKTAKKPSKAPAKAKPAAKRPKAPPTPAVAVQLTFDFGEALP